jgi:hypothetical protein
MSNIKTNYVNFITDAIQVLNVEKQYVKAQIQSSLDEIETIQEKVSKLRNRLSGLDYRNQQLLRELQKNLNITPGVLIPENVENVENDDNVLDEWWKSCNNWTTHIPPYYKVTKWCLRSERKALGKEFEDLINNDEIMKMAETTCHSNYNEFIARICDAHRFTRKWENSSCHHYLGIIRKEPNRYRVLVVENLKKRTNIFKHIGRRGVFTYLYFLIILCACVDLKIARGYKLLQKLWAVCHISSVQKEEDMAIRKKFNIVEEDESS